ncbi:MAG: CaiB/BaiF CoA transferase family protein [Myxococcota bacterium]
MPPLQGIRVIELAGLAPVPYCGMILADFGADVIRVDRTKPGFLPSRPDDPLGRGKRSMRVDLKKPDGAQVVAKLARDADVLLDPFRPGALERRGLGPDALMDRNPRLIYARLTGYGQDGPHSPRAGHDINYLALSGALSLCGRKQTPPTPPANLLADFAGGGLMCALGVVLALFERNASGRGQVLDTSMVEGAANLTTALHYLRHVGVWNDQRGSNWFDTGAPWYDVYETLDGKYMAVGALEPQFFAALLAGLGIDPSTLSHPMDPKGWTAMRETFASAFRSKTRDAWCEVFDEVDACVTPVLGLGELATHPHLAAREMIVQGPDGTPQPAPAPRLQRTPARKVTAAPREGEHTRAVLAELGYAVDDVERLMRTGAVTE